MNSEDADWLVYHQIPPTQTITADELSERCGIERTVMEESLARLERYCLIERREGGVRMLTFGEALIKNQFMHDKDLPFVIENGVIRERRS